MPGRTRTQHLLFLPLLAGMLSAQEATTRPAGARHTDPVQGWSIASPEGWKVERQGDGTELRRAGGEVLVRVRTQEPLEESGAYADLLIAELLDRHEELAAQPLLWRRPQVGATGPGPEEQGFVQLQASHAVSLEPVLEVQVRRLPQFEVQLLLRRASPGPAREGRAVLWSFEADGGEGPYGRPRLEERRGFGSQGAPPVSFRVPSRWDAVTTSSRMRLAQYRIPGEEPASAIVWHFGAGGGGGVQPNVERWVGQFETEEPASVEKREIAEGVQATVIEVSGTYVAETRPGSGERLNEPGWRMLAAILEVPQGPLYVKLVGPEATLEDTSEEFKAWIGSFRAEKR